MKISDVPFEHLRSLRRFGGKYRVRHFRKAVPKRIRQRQKRTAKLLRRDQRFTEFLQESAVQSIRVSASMAELKLSTAKVQEALRTLHQRKWHR